VGRGVAEVESAELCLASYARHHNPAVLAAVLPDLGLPALEACSYQANQAEEHFGSLVRLGMVHIEVLRPTVRSTVGTIWRLLRRLRSWLWLRHRMPLLELLLLRLLALLALLLLLLLLLILIRRSEPRSTLVLNNGAEERTLAVPNARRLRVWSGTLPSSDVLRRATAHLQFMSQACDFFVVPLDLSDHRSRARVRTHLCLI
jgi:hypothetical protein